MKYTVSFKLAAHKKAIRDSEDLPSLKSVFGSEERVKVIRTYGRGGHNALIEASPEAIDKLRKDHSNLVFALSGPAKAYAVG